MWASCFRPTLRLDPGSPLTKFHSNQSPIPHPRPLSLVLLLFRYLISVSPQDVSLLQAHAGWVLQADPEAGLELLLAADPPLHYTLVLPLLEVRNPPVV